MITKTPLPASEIRYSEAIGGKIKTIGNKWAEYQIVEYKSFQQPLYVMIDAEGNDLTEGIGYTPSIEEYKSFLVKGIKAYNKQ